MGNSSGMFTATSFPLVSGVYTGTGNFQTLTNGVSTATPITMQVSLQQGATVLDPTTGAFQAEQYCDWGKHSCAGISVLYVRHREYDPIRSSEEPSSSIAGNIMRMNFTMDDGSTLGLTGALS